MYRKRQNSLKNIVKMVKIMKEKMILNTESGHYAMVGGAILGGGGGGSEEMGKSLLSKLADFPELKLVSLDDIDDDAIILSASLVGAPAAVEQYLEPKDMIRTVELFRESNPDVKLGGIMTNENGFCATVNGWVQAAATGLPFVDAQCNGRAHPTGVMGSMNLHKDPSFVTTMTFAGGNPAIARYVEGIVKGSIDHTATLVRAASAEAGGVVGVARNPVTAAHVRKNGAVNGISQSIELGRRYEEGLKTSVKAAVEAAVEYLDGNILICGKVDKYDIETRGGFDVGVLNIGGNELTFWNEYMTLTDKDGKRLATFPDLIMTIDAKTGRPMPTADIRKDEEVYIIYTDHSNLNLSPTMFDESLLAPIEGIVGRKILKYCEIRS